MRKLIGLGLAAAVAGAGLAVSAVGAPAAETTKIVYHSKLPQRNNEILVVSSAGGAPTRLTRHVASDSNPTWSADGRKIAFESNRRGNPRRYEDSDVYVARADGSGIRQLTFSNAFDGDPAWSVSNRIAFESERTGSSDVWAIDSDGSDETQLTKNSAFEQGSCVVSRRLEDRFHERAGQRRSRDLRHERRRFGPDQAHAQPRLRREPSWSPNGKRIAFDSVRDGNLEVYVMNADGSRQTASPTIRRWTLSRPGRRTRGRSCSSPTGSARDSGACTSRTPTARMYGC